jgi:predicted nuclease of predicted toxin-antitoxin system
MAEGLRRHGIDVTTSADAGLLHATDEEQLAFVTAESRVICTQDADFLRIDAAGTQHPGIVYCHQESRSLGEIIRRLVLIWEVYEPEEMKNRVEFI